MTPIQKAAELLEQSAGPFDEACRIVREHCADRSGAALIAAERQRQITAEGWTPEHDDAHKAGEMGMAAASYIWHSRAQNYANEQQEGRVVRNPPPGWPWEKTWWKPGSPIKSLVKAGALIAAEIDRLLRTVPVTPEAGRTDVAPEPKTGPAPRQSDPRAAAEYVELLATDVAPEPKTGPVPLEDLRRLCGGREPHRGDGWTQDDLPAGYRPYFHGEDQQTDDEFFDTAIEEWVRVGDRIVGPFFTPDEQSCKHRTRRPLPPPPPPEAQEPPFRRPVLGGNPAQDAAQTARAAQVRDKEDRAWAMGELTANAAKWTNRQRANSAWNLLNFALACFPEPVEHQGMQLVLKARELCDIIVHDPTSAQSRAEPDEEAVRRLFEQDESDLRRSRAHPTEYLEHRVQARWLGFLSGFRANRRTGA